MTTLAFSKITAALETILDKASDVDAQILIDAITTYRKGNERTWRHLRNQPAMRELLDTLADACHDRADRCDLVE